MQLLLSSIL
uniref:Uncharacterized protein n=1 Tax=Anguilla anguilla TaxID=7936 RepID=A0A0E9TD48_ANGAN